VIENRESLARTNDHAAALAAVEAGIEAARPDPALERACSRADGVPSVEGAAYELGEYDDVLLVGGGKAAGELAAGLEDRLGERVDGGSVLATAPAETEGVETVLGTHPLPSERNRAGTERVLAAADRAGPGDLVVVALTGGGSALLTAPAPGVSVSTLRSVTDGLVRAGASIDELNAVRKHLSAIKGGRLAERIAPATALTVAISDVVGNRLGVIASGPTAPDPTTYEDALAALERYSVTAPAAADVLQAGADGERAETPTEPVEGVTHRIVADGDTALVAAAGACERAGYPAQTLSARVEGEASEVGRVHGAIARSCARRGRPFEPPVALLSGGETTVTVEGEGTGGPNQEFVLGAAVALAGVDAPVAVCAVDTDGRDGPTDAAGGLIDQSVPKGNAEAALAANDTGPFLAERGGLVRTGRTGTNVNDLRVVIVGD